MTTQFQGYHVHFEPGTIPDATPLLLLHGTGGDEHDLITFGARVAPGAPLLGVRGTQMEGTITRWFKRHGEGVFDLPDLKLQAGHLAAWIPAASRHFGMSQPPIAVGYSNGGNITGGLLMRHSGILTGAVLMRCMCGLEPSPDLNLAGLPVLMLNGRDDPLAPRDKQARLAQLLADHGAKVEQQVPSPGHELTAADAEAARRWFKNLATPVA